MRRSLVVTAAAAGVIALGAGGVAIAQNGDAPAPGFTQAPLAGATELELDAVPAAVRHTANQAARGGELTSAQLDLDGVAAVYELAGKDADGADVEVDVYADGTLEEIETVIEAADVPAAVTERLSSALPDFKYETVERSIRPTKVGLLETWYEFGGEEADVEIDSRGSQYLVEPA
jgi:hypothetical protein